MQWIGIRRGVGTTEGKPEMKTFIGCAVACLCIAAAANASGLPAWRGHAANAQHTARAPTAGQSLAAIHWSMSIDHAAPTRAHGGMPGGEPLIHYASPLIT